MLRRIALLSFHTSPLDQPGTGDAGGMNVYIVEVAKRLARRGIEVEIFTRAVCRDTPSVTELVPGVLVRSVVAGPFEELDKADLPPQVCPFTFEVLRTEAAHAPGRYDLVHGHYWLSGLVGAVARERWGIPFVQSMHTLAKVKNAALARDSRPAANGKPATNRLATNRLATNGKPATNGAPARTRTPPKIANTEDGQLGGGNAEPEIRIRGEVDVVAAADRLVANTAEEARQLVDLYGAERERVDTVTPGVDLGTFRPASQEDKISARRRLGLPEAGLIVVFAGRVQPLKGPDIVLHAAARLAQAHQELTVVMVGGPSGQERSDPERMRVLASSLGIGRLVRHEPPCPQHVLADWYTAATVVLVPSYSESFGLVALEAQACGTPVIAAGVGGLRTAVRHGISGILIDGHDPARYAEAIDRLAAHPAELRALSAGAVEHAAGFGWQNTVDGLIGVYTGAMETARVRA